MLNDWVKAGESPLLVAQEVLRSEQAALEKQHISVTVKGSTAQATIDSQALSRVMRNLLRNAVEAGANAIEVTVEKNSNRHLELIVQDNGDGMSPEEIKQVFDPFYTTKAKGTGLGLVISQQELEEFGATIQCESVKGEFSRFILNLPATVDNLTIDEKLS